MKKHDFATRVIHAGQSPDPSTGAIMTYVHRRIGHLPMAVHPLVPRGRASFRIQISAANTWDQIESLIRTLGELTDRFRLQSAAA